MNAYVLVTAAAMALSLTSGTPEISGEAPQVEGNNGNGAAQEEIPLGQALCDSSHCLMSPQTLQNMEVILQSQARELREMRQFGCGIRPT